MSRRIANSLIVRSHVTDPAWNLACVTQLETAMAKHDAPAQQLLYLCRSGPRGQVLLGKHNNAASDVHWQRAQAAHIPVLRRSSGGGVRYIEPGNILFGWFTRDCLEVVHPSSSWLWCSLGFWPKLVAHVSNNGASMHFQGVVHIEQDPNMQKMLIPVTTRQITQEPLIESSAAVVQARMEYEFAQVALKTAAMFEKQHSIVTMDCNDVHDLWPHPFDRAAFDQTYSKMRETVYNTNPEFDHVHHGVFSFGFLELHIEVGAPGSMISRAMVFSDAEDTVFVARLRDSLMHKHYNPQILANGIDAYFALPVLLPDPTAAARHRLFANQVSAWLRRS